jgi:hypothetical protein
MAWTDWKLLVDRHHWYDVMGLDGPGCYQLALGTGQAIIHSVVFVDDTANMREQLDAHGRRESHLSDIIDAFVVRGWMLYYRAWPCETRQSGKQLATALRENFDFVWNQRPVPVLGQGDRTLMLGGMQRR